VHVGQTEIGEIFHADRSIEKGVKLFMNKEQHVSYMINGKKELGGALRTKHFIISFSGFSLPGLNSLFSLLVGLKLSETLTELKGIDNELSIQRIKEICDKTAIDGLLVAFIKFRKGFLLREAEILKALE